MSYISIVLYKAAFSNKNLTFLKTSEAAWYSLRTSDAAIATTCGVEQLQQWKSLP